MISRAATVRGAWIVAALLLVLGALAHKVDHDESQYVAAVALMRGGWPFRDFAYLQTPLQPLLLAPLAWLERVPLLPVLRLFNVAASLLAVAAVAAAAREAGASRHGAQVAALLMLACGPALFAATVARNDALPMLFYAAGIGLLLRAATRGGAAVAAVAGLAFGCAASTKISYAIPGAAAAIGALACQRRLGVRGVASFALGGLAGLAPTIGFALAEPAAFRFEVIDYAIDAPREWSAINGERTIFSPAARAWRFVKYLAPGPAIVVLLLLAVRARRPAGAAVRLLDVLIVAGLVAAVLPQPTYRQYLVPILPPLFARLATLRFATIGRGWRLLMALGAIAGLAPTIVAAAKTTRRGATALDVARDARWIGARTAGPVATLSPERVTGGGAAIDPRFAAGPFLFRTLRLLDGAAAARLHVATLGSFADQFAASPPAAIVTGGERRTSPAAPTGTDAALDRWAAAHGWRAERGPGGRLTLWLPPQRGFRSAPRAAIAPAKR